MNFLLVIFVLQPVILSVVCSEAGACETSSILNVFPEFEKMNAQLDERANKLKNHAKLLTELKKRGDEEAVAFSAVIESTSYSGINVDRVIFDKAELNIGMAYNLGADIFIAPYKGVYQFSLEALTASLNCAVFRLMKDGQAVKDLFVANSGSAWTSTGTATLLKLKKGDFVWVEMDAYTCSKPTNYFNITLEFSGFYVRRS